MKVLIVVDDFHGGSGNIASLLALKLKEKNQVALMMTNLHSEPRYDLSGIDVLNVNFSINRKNKILGLLSVVSKAKKVVKKNIRPDLIISFIDNTNSIICLSQWFNKTPIIVSERSNPLAIFPKSPWDKIRRIAYKRANVVTVQFKHFVSFDGGRYEKKALVTSNIVKKPTCFKTDYSCDKVRFVSFARLSNIKRFDLMIELFALAEKQNPNIELHIFGDGQNKEKLQNLINEKGLSNKVFLRGYCNNVHQTLTQFDAYLMTSLQEGFPNSLCEAMAVGLPTLSIACHEGVVELGEEGLSGLAAKEGDNKEFVDKMLLLAKDESLRKSLGERAKTISDKYNEENVVLQWQNCICKAMIKNKGKK